MKKLNCSTIVIIILLLIIFVFLAVYFSVVIDLSNASQILQMI